MLFSRSYRTKLVKLYAPQTRQGPLQRPLRLFSHHPPSLINIDAQGRERFFTAHDNRSRDGLFSEGNVHNVPILDRTTVLKTHEKQLNGIHLAQTQWKGHRLGFESVFQGSCSSIPFGCYRCCFRGAEDHFFWWSSLRTIQASNPTRSGNGMRSSD